MITTQNLTDLGFNEILDIFSGKQVWVLGEEDTEICGNSCRLPILYYNIETQTCKVVRSEFCVVQRECKTEEEIRKFVESINFLFHISVVIKSVCTCMAFHKSDECYKLGCKAHRSDNVQTVL